MNVLAMVEQGTIPHSVLPTGKTVFLRNRLYDWLLSKDPTIEGNSLNTNGEQVIPSFYDAG